MRCSASPHWPLRASVHYGCCRYLVFLLMVQLTTLAPSPSSKNHLLVHISKILLWPHKWWECEVLQQPDKEIRGSTAEFQLSRETLGGVFLCLWPAELLSTPGPGESFCCTAINSIANSLIRKEKSRNPKAVMKSTNLTPASLPTFGPTVCHCPLAFKKQSLL